MRQERRDREKAEALAQRLAAKEHHRLERARLAAESARRKAAARDQRQREKHRHRRHKRLDALRQRIMHRLGLA
jgi:hypothetical protein